MTPNIYCHPRSGIFGRLIELIANSRLLATMRRAVLSRVPFLRLESDVTDVVYITWLVPVNACKQFIPDGLRVWERNGLTPFTVLTYRHGHFGPAILGPLRRMFPSPIQSNWRLYLAHSPSGEPQVPTVLFLKNVMDNLLYTLGTRLFSDALPTHLAAGFAHDQTAVGFETEISSGSGSAPSLTCSVLVDDDKALSPDFTSMFGSWRNAVEFLACQGAAVTFVESCNRLAFSEIELPIDVSNVLPALPIDDGVNCSLLALLQPHSHPLCFVVPNVRFRAISEHLL
jgi:hypothetical protein